MNDSQASETNMPIEVFVRARWSLAVPYDKMILFIGGLSYPSTGTVAGTTCTSHQY